MCSTVPGTESLLLFLHTNNRRNAGNDLSELSNCQKMSVYEVKSMCLKTQTTSVMGLFFIEPYYVHESCCKLQESLSHMLRVIYFVKRKMPIIARHTMFLNVTDAKAVARHAGTCQ